MKLSIFSLSACGEADQNLLTEVAEIVAGFCRKVSFETLFSYNYNIMSRQYIMSRFCVMILKSSIEYRNVSIIICAAVILEHLANVMNDTTCTTVKKGIVGVVLIMGQIPMICLRDILYWMGNVEPFLDRAAMGLIPQILYIHHIADTVLRTESSSVPSEAQILGMQKSTSSELCYNLSPDQVRNLFILLFH